MSGAQHCLAVERRTQILMQGLIILTLDKQQDEVEPQALEYNREEKFNLELFKKCGELGLLGCTVDPEFGGSGMDASAHCIIHEELSAADPAFCLSYLAHSSLFVNNLYQNGNDEQRERWLKPLMSGKAIGCFALTEPNAGSDVASLTTHAVEQPDGSYRVNGGKHWVTNAGVADVMLLFATVDPKLAGKGITAFAIDTAREGLHRKPMEGVELGHRGSDHAVLTFENMPVQKSEILGTVGKGFGIALGGLSSGRLSVAAGAVGIHRAALSAAVRFTTEREQFGQPLAHFQMVQERLADMLTSLHASRALVHRCATRRANKRETHARANLGSLWSLKGTRP